MKVLVAYDVGTVDPAGNKRLRRVARACQDYGIRVQKSLFECVVGDKEWALLRNKLFDEYNPLFDSLRFYFLDADVQIEHHGHNAPIDLDGPLVVGGTSAEGIANIEW